MHSLPPLPHLSHLDTYNTSKSEDFATIFDDFLQFDDLYQKPVFGDCVWTDATADNATTTVYGAWLPLDCTGK